MDNQFLQALYAASYNNTRQQLKQAAWVKQAVNGEAIAGGALGTTAGAVLGALGAQNLYDRNPTGNAALAGPLAALLGGAAGGVAGSYIPGSPVLGAGGGALLGSLVAGLGAHAVANRNNTTGSPTMGASKRIQAKTLAGVPLTPEEKKLRPVVEQLMWAQDKLSNGTEAEKRKANQIILSAAGVK